MRIESQEARRRQRRARTVAFGASAAVGVASVFGGAVAPAGADTTFTVNDPGDGGDGTCDATCTLRDALDDADNTAGADVVTFASTVTGTITLTSEIDITQPVEIRGPGANVLAVSGNDLVRIFNIDGTDGAENVVLIDGLTLKDGRAGSGGAIIADETVLTISNSVLTGNVATSDGGALYTSDGNFVMINTVVSDNTAAGYGGGIDVEDNDVGDILIRDSTITGNTAEDGGGIMLYDLNRGSEGAEEFGATILRTTVSGNTATDEGGGIYLEDAYENGGAILIEDSTISGNTAATEGGGIFRGEGDGNDTDKLTTIRNTTISGNTAGTTGGGIYWDDDDDNTHVIANSTITGNSAASVGGIFRLAADDDARTEGLAVRNTIVANNTNGDLGQGGTPEGSFVLSHSLIEDVAAGVTTEGVAASNLTGVDPQLGPLANNGGPTSTHKPAAGSPAIGAGDPDFAPPPTLDQRGFPREVGRLDIGAVEVEATIVVGDVAVTETDAAGVVATFPVTLSAPANSPVTVNYTTTAGSASAGSDYTTTAGTVTFAAGETAKTIVVPILGDNDKEGTESFTVTLSAPNGAALADGEGTATITDDDVQDLGYRMVAADGGIFTFGDRLFHGSTGDLKLNKPIVGGATDVSDNDGYWIVASDGGVFTFSAPFFGSLGDQVLASPAVEIEPTPTGKGYWIVLADGKVYTFGDANHFGDMSGKALNKPIIGMSVTPSGKGYWLVAEDGGIFNFGDAGFFGSMGDKVLNAPVIDLAPSVDNQGYYLLGRDGGVFTFGSADFKGSTGDRKLNAPVVAMLVAPNGAGYWFAASDGGVFTFGTVPFLGSMGDTKLNSPVLDLIY